jgi:hypothetical protein
MISLPLPPPRSAATIRSAILSAATIKRLRPTQRIIFARWENIKLFTTANWSASRPDFIFVHNGFVIFELLAAAAVCAGRATSSGFGHRKNESLQLEWSPENTERERRPLSLCVRGILFLEWKVSK